MCVYMEPTRANWVGTHVDRVTRFRSQLQNTSLVFLLRDHRKNPINVELAIAMYHIHVLKISIVLHMYVGQTIG